MARLPRSIQNPIDELSRLPGIGPKSAARLVFYLLSKPDSFVEELSASVSNLKKDLKICSECYNYAETDPCNICTSDRVKSKICVVEDPLDVIALERTGFDGVYHVLGGIISPVNGIGPEQIRIEQLVDKLKNTEVETEIILATNPSIEGEATASYICNRVEGLKVKITQLARGLPVGGDLEYADELTLLRSLEGRKDF